MHISVNNFIFLGSAPGEYHTQTCTHKQKQTRTHRHMHTNTCTSTHTQTHAVLSLAVLSQCTYYISVLILSELAMRWEKFLPLQGFEPQPLQHANHLITAHPKHNFVTFCHTPLIIKPQLQVLDFGICLFRLASLVSNYELCSLAMNWPK